MGRSRTTKAYATASTDCLPVVAGVLPIDLYIQRRIHQHRISRGLPTVIRVEDYEDPDGRDNARKLVEERMVEAWQRRWDVTQKGRHMYALFLNATLHHTDGHGPRGIQGEIAQAGTGQGLSN